MDLEKSEQELSNFREENPFSRTPSLEEYRGRLERNIESNQQVYITLRQQFEIAKIDEAREYLLVTILDEAEPAIYKSKPKRTLLTLAGFISGLFLSFFIAFFRSLIKPVQAGANGTLKYVVKKGSGKNKIASTRQ